VRTSIAAPDCGSSTGGGVGTEVGDAEDGSVIAAVAGRFWRERERERPWLIVQGRKRRRTEATGAFLTPQSPWVKSF
jgi:hypothetical protein